MNGFNCKIGAWMGIGIVFGDLFAKWYIWHKVPSDVKDTLQKAESFLPTVSPQNPSPKTSQNFVKQIVFDPVVIITTLMSLFCLFNYKRR